MRISDWSSDVCSSDLVNKNAAFQSKFIGSGAKRNQKLRRAGIINIPAQAVGRWPVPRPDPAWFEPANGIEETVIPPNIFPKPEDIRSKERRVGKECVRQCKSRW